MRSEVCEKYGIDDAMQNTVLPLLQSWQADTGLQILDYEWGGSCIADDDTQFFDGFHLDELYGLPDWDPGTVRRCERPARGRLTGRETPMALDFLILYEHTVREYESDLLLKLELERRGYTVEIRQLLDPKYRRLFGKDKPEVLVASCMYDNEAINSHVYNNIGRCNKIVNLHWEQMLSDTQEEGDWFNMNGNAKRCIQTCWGKRTAARLQAHGMEAKNTPVTGAVMMDFLRPEFKGYFKDKAALCREFGLDPAKQLHLYISSFGYASMSDEEGGRAFQNGGHRFQRLCRHQPRFDGRNAALVRRLPGRPPGGGACLPPPPERVEQPGAGSAGQKAAQLPCDLCRFGQQWIVAADSISIWMSTAIAEVYMAGKSCHILRPAPIEHEYDPVIYKGARYVTNYEDFCAAMAEQDRPSPLSGRSLRDILTPARAGLPAHGRPA